jgi:hypothetical protein
MADKPWKRMERCVARKVKTLRKPGSGSWGRSDQTQSDTVDEVLFIEAKQRKQCFTCRLLKETRVLAKKEGKIAVVVQQESGKPGRAWTVHEDDLHAFCIEYAGRHLTPTTLDEIQDVAENFKPLGDDSNDEGEPSQDR